MATRGKTGGRKKASSETKKTGKGVKPSTVFLLAFGTVAAAGGAYLIYDRIKARRLAQSLPGSDSKDTIIINNNLPASSSSSKIASKSGATANDNFPLKEGSRGPRVTLLQQGLDSLLGEGTMKKMYGGVDGIFGPLTAAALQAIGFDVIVDEKTFNAITKGFVSPGSSLINPSEIALLLYRAAQNKILANVITVLRQITSVVDYALVNERYKTHGLIQRTIVTDLLDYAFKYDETAKKQIRDEFVRIGLKVDDKGRWGLQGINLYKDIVTLRDTVVTDSRHNKIPVKKNTILGDEVKNENGMTWFRSVDNGILQVPTQDVKYT